MFGLRTVFQQKGFHLWSHLDFWVCEERNTSSRFHRSVTGTSYCSMENTLFEVGFRLALSSVQSTNARSTLSRGLFMTLCFLTIIAPEGLGYQYPSPYLRLRIPYSVQFHLVQCITGCFPPGWGTILFPTRASLALQACQPELSKMNTAISAGKALLKKSMAFCSIDHISRIPSAIVIYSATVFDSSIVHLLLLDFLRIRYMIFMAAGTADDDLGRTHGEGVSCIISWTARV